MSANIDRIVYHVDMNSHAVSIHGMKTVYTAILHKLCRQFLLGVKMAPGETENNAYANFWGDKQRTLWYVMVFSGVVNCVPQ